VPAFLPITIAGNLTAAQNPLSLRPKLYLQQARSVITLRSFRDQLISPRTTLQRSAGTRSIMAIEQRFLDLAGEWRGTNRLHLPWMPAPLLESPSQATIRPLAGGQCLELVYTWTYEGKPQEGVLLINGDPASSAVRAVWTDSWHSANVLMICEGSVSEAGSISVKGTYAVPDHPDWGWRTELFVEGADLNYVMYNISPEGKEELAVETRFSRTEAQAPATAQGSSP
jgi:hypothetical protein